MHSADNLDNVASYTLWGGKTLLIGEEYYTTEKDLLSPDELTIAADLGLNTEAGILI